MIAKAPTVFFNKAVDGYLSLKKPRRTIAEIRIIPEVTEKKYLRQLLLKF